MKLLFHPSFKKSFRKRSLKIQEAFRLRLELFMQTPHHPLLNNHSVDRAYQRHRSINITGDLRALYTESDDAVTFTMIGTHSELY
jgi:mRNA-degrading endonuclease YafQ of YafQ-DinJ toxin-antitoxin module